MGDPTPEELFCGQVENLMEKMFKTDLIPLCLLEE